MTTVAVVILNYNGRELLQKFLPGVVEHSHPHHVVVADNGSTDGSADFVSKNFPSIELIRINSNLGFCGGYNFALKNVRADYYVLLNSDVQVTPGWLTPLVKLLETDQGAAAVQPKILSQKEPEFFEYAGAAGGFLDVMGYPFCRGRMFYAMEKDQGQYDDRKEIFWASGACIMMRSKLFHELGGLDEDFFAHMEEIDLCWRFQRAGHTVWYEGNSVVYHVGGGTLSSANPRKTYLNFKNGLSLLFKNLPLHELLVKIPLRIGLDWVAAMKFGFSGALRDGAAVLKAHRHFFWNFGNERKRRRKTSSLVFSVPRTIYHGLIVWDFFVAGKRKYTDLDPSKIQH